CPAGLPLNKDDVMAYMNRRKPGTNSFTTPRKESDEIEILSGIFNGFTTGTPISMMVRNADQHSKDYDKIAEYYRPGHADYTFDKKYGFRDYRGGGRSSGRETLARVAAGAVAAKLLKEFGIEVLAYTHSIGSITLPEQILANKSELTRDEVLKSKLFIPDEDTTKKAEEYLLGIKNELNSSGGVVECIVRGLPAGLGEPVFDKLDAKLGQALFSIGAVKGVEIGDGFAAGKSTGLCNNDAFILKDGKISKATNHSGGVLGGISDSSTLVVRAAFKPTPSISATQHTVNKNMEELEINIEGRHDPIIVSRAVVVVESMTALVLADLLLQNSIARLDNLKKIYDASPIP
ncbi:MAG: chorismate synthase, partial [Catonella sp.]|uniref:chorismate synthase n=1 Tax=Catonella sp. TaxID=2382125 RepID=UPI003F9FC6B0